MGEVHRMGKRFQHEILAAAVDNSFPVTAFVARRFPFIGRTVRWGFLSKSGSENGGAARFEAKDGVFLSSVYIRLSEGQKLSQ